MNQREGSMREEKKRVFLTQWKNKTLNFIHKLNNTLQQLSSTIYIDPFYKEKEEV